MTYTKISSEEIVDKILNNMTLSKVSGRHETENSLCFAKELKEKTILRGLISILGRPYEIVHGLEPNRADERLSCLKEGRYHLIWQRGCSIGLTYTPKDLSSLSGSEAQNRSLWQYTNQESVKISKKVGRLFDMDTNFTYFFDGKSELLSHITSRVMGFEGIHRVLFPKYEGILNKVDEDYVFTKPAYSQGIELTRKRFIEEVEKILRSEKLNRINKIK